MSFEKRLLDCQTHVNACLTRLLPTSHDSLAQAMRYVTLNGGKRLRPLLTYTTAALFSLPASGVDPIALAIECIHCYSLVHDDLPAMDNDDLRRGKPTCHKAFNEATAILTGDALLTLAFELLSQDSSTPISVIHLIARAAGFAGMVRGQSLDMASQGHAISYEQLCDIHHSKTGALITASIVASALAANASAEDENALRLFGESIGIAFQIQDDILDATSSYEHMGKTTQQDAQKQKCTFVTLLGIEEAKRKVSFYHERAFNALSSFGTKANPLRDISTYIIERSA